MEKEASEVLDGLSDLVICDRIVAAFVVGRIADDGVVDRCEMHTDLMGAAGFDLNIKKGEFLVPLTDLPDGESVPAIRGNGHFRPMPAVASDRAIYRSGIFSRTAVHKSYVGFLHVAIAEYSG